MTSVESRCDISMDIKEDIGIAEVNEHFDIVVYPEKEDKLLDKQGITVKGCSEQFRQTVELWRRMLVSKETRERKFKGASFKILKVSQEKGGSKAIVSVTEGKCAMTVFNTGTILLARVKGSEFEAVREFATESFIPITKAIIEETVSSAELDKLFLVDIGAAVNTCKQCGLGFSSQNLLREHIDDAHVEQENVGKRKRSDLDSIGNKSIPEADLLTQMSDTVRILNNRIDILQEKVKLDKEVIDELSIKIEEGNDKLRRVTLEAEGAEGAVDKLKAELEVSLREKYKLETESQNIIDALTSKNEALNFQLAQSRDSVQMNYAEAAKKAVIDMEVDTDDQSDKAEDSNGDIPEGED